MNMFYTMFVLVFGVFLGQEYSSLPSVKNSWNKMVDYFGNVPGTSGTSESVSQPSGPTESMGFDLNKISSFLKMFVGERVLDNSKKKE